MTEAFLALTKLILDELALGDVSQHPNSSGRFPLYRPAPVVDPDDLSVLFDDPDIHVTRLLALRVYLVDMPVELGLIFRVDDVAHQHSVLHELLGAKPGDLLAGGRDPDHLALRPAPVFPFMGEIGHSAKFFLAFLQFLGPFNHPLLKRFIDQLDLVIVLR